MGSRQEFAAFAKGLQDELGEPEKVIGILVRGLGFRATRGVVMRTPVKTGRARGSWQATLDFPSQDAVEVQDKSGSSTMRAAESVLSQFIGFGKFYLTSNLVYILALEEGHSDRAPNGMVSVTLESLTR